MMSGALLDEDVDASAQDGPSYLAHRSVDTLDQGLDLNVAGTAKKQALSREPEGNVSKRSTSKVRRKWELTPEKMTTTTLATTQVTSATTSKEETSPKASSTTSTRKGLKTLQKTTPGAAPVA